jgi:hypothetical protein
MAKLVEVNPNLKIGIAFDTHAPQEYNVTLFDDKSGVTYKRQTDNFDMRAYADGILGCLFAREGKLVRQDWQNKLIKWVKQGSKHHHVHVLLRDSVSRGEQEHKIEVFHNLNDAKKKMEDEYQAELNDWKTWCDDVINEDGKTSRSIYERGEYMYNHVSWVIETQIIK